MTGRRVIVDHCGARAPAGGSLMNLDRCTHADFLEIVSDVEDFCGTDHALDRSSPMFVDEIAESFQAAGAAGIAVPPRDRIATPAA
jgi:hypothetical protein